MNMLFNRSNRKKLSRLATASALLLSLNVSPLSAQTVAPFKNGDRVAFVGNSITDGGHYHSYMWLYYMTRFPDLKVTFLNAGIGGDVSKQLSRRLDDDVLARNPTVVTLTWGMNDTGYMEWWKDDAEETFRKRLDTSKKYYHIMEAKLKKLPNVRKIIIASSPYDETTTSAPNNVYKGKSAALLKIAEFQEQAAKSNGWGFIDLNRPMTAINQNGQKTDPAYSLTPNDRIHPDNDGHMVMAYLLLKAQGLANRPIADVVVDAGSAKSTKALNAKITDVARTANGISFNYLAGALPYPMDTISRGWGNKRKQADALKVIPFTKEFNQELLTVKGLSAGIYILQIDGEAVGSWSADDLAKGMNLAEQTNTPQYQQALQIMTLNEERWEIERRFRNHAFIEFNVLFDRGLYNADNKVAMDTVNAVAKREIFVAGNKQNYLMSQYKTVRQAWQKEMDVLIAQIYSINKPLNRKITLTRTN